MIQQGSYIEVSDNSGAKLVCCLKVVQGYKRRYAKIGDIVVVSVKKLRSKRRAQSKVQKGSILRGILVRTSKDTSFSDGTFQRYLDNSVALLNKQGRPLGSRILGSVPKSLRYSKYMRLVSLSAGLIK